MKHPRYSFQSVANIGPVLIVSAAVLWALDGIVRRSLFTLPPITIVFFEHAIGSLLIAPVFWHALQKSGDGIGGAVKKILSQRVLGLALVVSLLSGLLGTLWFTQALSMVNFIPFSVVFLLQKLQPLFAISAAAWLLGERVSWRYAKWAAFAMVAAYFVTFPKGFVNLATGGGTIWAALFAVGAAAAWGSMTAVSKLLIAETKDHTLATGLRFFMTSLLAFPTVFLLGAQASLTAVTGEQIVRLVFIALSTGMVALWLYYKGLQTTQAKVSTILELTFPLLAVFIDAVLYWTFLDWSQYLAAMVLLFAMYQVGKIELAKKPLG